MSATTRLYAGNLTEDLLARVAAAPDHIALKRRIGGEWTDVTTAEFHEEVMAVAKGLIARGVAVGDKVGIVAKTSYEWTLLDYAIWWCGAICVPIYESSSAIQLRRIASESGLTVLFASESLLTVSQRAGDSVRVYGIDESLRSVIVDGESISDTELEERRRTLGPESIATIIFTSGTTGHPKGCVLTHGNFEAEISAAVSALPELFEHPGASTLVFLPLTHVFSRIIEMVCIRTGVTLGHTADTTELAVELSSFRPSFLLAVPRVFEQIFNAASAAAYAEGEGANFDRAARTAIAYSRSLDSRKGPNLALRVRHAMYQRTVYRRLHDLVGSRVTHVVSGGAPLGDRLAHFFRGIGLTILEGYGLTETTAAVCVNRASDPHVGTAGTAVDGIDLRVSDDGELLIRGPQVFAGYWHGDGHIISAVDDDGWFHSGDLADIDESGVVRITGRTEELIVTASGKNVAPAILEDKVRSHPWVAQCVLVGEGKPFIAALVTVDPEQYDGDLDDPQLREGIQEAIDEANREVSRAESIRRFVIVSKAWQADSGYVTPSYKVKRFAVLRDHHDIIEGIYAR